MDLKEIFYPESRFGGFSSIDGTIAFYVRVNALINTSDTVVDFGCGRGALGEDKVAFRRSLRNLKGKASRVIGLDVDPAAASNPFIDEFHLMQDTCWPIKDNSIDLVVSDSVVEHLENPQVFFEEACRILKDSGYLCLRTPNLWSYPALFSRLIPNRSHTRVLNKVKDQVTEVDVFPTYYRCNTIPKINKMLRQQGFYPMVYGYATEPGYLSFSRLAYALGVIYQHIAPGFLQPVILAFGKKCSTDHVIKRQ